MSPFGRLMESPSIRNFALDLGLVSGHEDYTRFIVLGRSRSGSNLLRGLLNSHPQVTAFGEIFQNKETISWGLTGYGQGKRLHQQFQNDPVALLRSQVFRKQPAGICAVGFKIFYYHAQDERWRAVWEYLIQDEAIHVVHIKRNNVLRTHLSRKLAMETDRWVNVTGEDQRFRPVALDFEECLADFTQTQSWHDAYDKLFDDHPVCHVEYESLAADIGGEMARVQQFLGVERLEVAPETHRQITKPLSESISNYVELKQQFAGTEWQAFFED